MTAQVFWQGSAEIATLSNTFAVNGVATDPGTVSLVVTDPLGTATTYAYGGLGTITKVATGEYSQQVACVTDGLWSYVWIGTGACSDITPGTWTVLPVTLGQRYCSMEQLKSRLKILNSDDDLELQLAIGTAARSVNDFCGRFFWNETGTRTYAPEDIYTQRVDDLVSVSSLATDWDGDGIYETTWTPSDYQLEVFRHRYNQSASGEAWPYTIIRAMGQISGKYFPYVWPWTHQDRVQVTGTWGWPAVPENVRHAALVLAVDWFKLKDAPFGISGAAEYSIRVMPGSQAYGLLARYVSGMKVGV